MNLGQAEAVRGELDSKLFEAKRELAELDARRMAVSFEAYTGGDLAKKQLDRANKERIGLLNSIEELEAALAEAGRRVDAAEREAGDGSAVGACGEGAGDCGAHRGSRREVGRGVEDGDGRGERVRG